MDEKLEVKITVKNTGKMEAKEIVQLYIRDIYGSVTRPIKELKAFEKINLSPGEEKEVKFTISSEDLKFHNIDMKYVAEPGDFELFVGSSSNNNDLLKTNFVIE
jgi:beta-glucosidase